MPHLIIPDDQFALMQELMQGEEGQFFKDKISEVESVFASMPVTYEQDGKGMDAIVYLHYFCHAGDWYITEKDIEGKGTQQAFGWAELCAGCGEFGYISIDEIKSIKGVELDLHWTPKTLIEVLKNRD